MSDVLGFVIFLPILGVLGFIAYCELRAVRCSCCKSKFDRDTGVTSSGAQRVYDPQSGEMTPSAGPFCSVRCRDEYEALIRCDWCRARVAREHAIFVRYPGNTVDQGPAPIDYESLTAFFAWIGAGRPNPSSKVRTFCCLKCHTAYEAARNIKEIRTRTIVGE
jgi:hypothetical protein